MEFFLHPWYMVAGGALISSPILIHLINRMRFKRIRWAAMEFLLKSQKRNRRRLIIEQLILLFLRILLVLLAAFLVARFVQAGLSSGQGAVHVVLLDDSLSMSDRWGDKGQSVTTFDQAKDEIKKVAKEAALANSAQQMKVLLLSDLETVIFDQRLNETTVDQLGEALKDLQPTALHVSPLPGLERARAIFNDSPQSQKILHLASDLRDTDWATGASAEKLAEATDKLTGDGINFSLLDCAHPFRGTTRDVALNHDNLAVVDFRAESRIVAEGLPVEFTVAIYNYGPSEKQTFLKVKKDGQEDFAASAPLEKLIPFGRTEHKFTLVFDKKKASLAVGETDTREERQRKRRAEQEFVTISAEINAEETGLQRDNVRDLVLEVRKKVPTLVIDGNGPAGRQPGGDLFHLEEAFKAARSYEVDYRGLDDLDKIDLDLYPSVFLLNVQSIKSEKALQNLQGYVKRGGNLAFFLGEKVQPSFYNETLHRKYEGLFPVLLANRPSDPLTPEEREDRKQKDPQPKILFRDVKHPLVAELAKLSSVFRYLLIERYYPTLPRFQWEPETQKNAVEIVSLPNRKSMDDYKARAQELIAQTLERIKELSATDPTWEKYQPVLETNYRRQVINALSSPYLFNLVRAFDNLLNDLGVEKDPQRPNMKDLWNHPSMSSLKSRIETFRDTVLYGDPLVVAMPYGRGRVIACLTSAGTTSVTGAGGLSRWNEWGGGSPASFTYPIFMMDLQRYLTSESEGLNRVVGDELNFKLEASRYLPKVRRSFLPQPEPGARDAKAQPVALGEQELAVTGQTLSLRVTDTKRPGVYTFDFLPILDAAGEQPVETHAFAFNVDAANESDLRRAPRDKLERNRSGADSRIGKVALRSPGDNYDAFKNRLPDASESPWLYLLFLVVLIVEQALAVHLSFHLKPGEAPAPAVERTRRTQAEPAAAG